MLQTTNLADAVTAIRSASALTETTFLEVGQTLEASVEILAKLTSSFEAVLVDLRGEDLGQALQALSRIAAQVAELGENQSGDSASFDRLGGLALSIERRISQMKASLKDVDCLAVNSRIAAATIHAPGTDFTTFADEIGRTLTATRAALDSFAAELHIVRQHVAAAHTGQIAFEKHQHEASQSITERLLATMKSIAARHQRAARASLEVRLGSARVRERICNAVMALQIGDITRQRLEHADHALGLVVAAGTSHRPAGEATLNDDEQLAFIMVNHRLQSAQLSDAARGFDREVRQISDSLGSLAREARALRELGNAAYGASDRGGGSFIKKLEEQVSEAIALFEGFETTQTEVARVTASVSDATDSLCGHLRKVQALEDDIRIMGLNTTFKCARVGREGLALSLIAQELRTYANGFAKEAGALMREVENVAGITGSLIGGKMGERAPLMSGGAQTMRDSLATLRQTGDILDVAAAELEHDSNRVETLLLATVTTLQRQKEVGLAMRGAAGNLAASVPPGDLDLADLGPRVEQMLALIEREYSMANERIVHDRVLGRSARVAPVANIAAAPELEDFLF